MNVKLQNKYEFNYNWSGTNYGKCFSRLNRICRNFSDVDIRFSRGRVPGVDLSFNYSLLNGLSGVRYRYIVKYRFRPVRSDFVRFLFGLGLSPCDCQSIAAAVDFDNFD